MTGNEEERKDTASKKPRQKQRKYERKDAREKASEKERNQL